MRGRPTRLASYHVRTQAGAVISLRRRGNASSWPYGITAAAAGAYAGFFADGSLVPLLGELGLVAGALIVLVRLFFMSATAHGFYQRPRHIRKRIERRWTHGTPTLGAIISAIDAYDHGLALPPTIRGVLRASEPPRALQRAHFSMRTCRNACRGRRTASVHVPPRPAP